MRKFVLGLLGALAVLVGCATGDVEQSVYSIRAAYDAGPLVAAVNYESLPRCDGANGPVCSDPGAVAELRKADLAAKVALDNAEDFVRNHPDLDPAVAIEAAQAAIDAFNRILVIYHIEVKE